MKVKNPNAIIVFQKNLVLGKVKTRLAVDLGKEETLDIYRQLIDATYKALQPLKNTEIFIFFSDYIEELPSDVPFNFTGYLQKGNDLGERMLNAFTGVFKKGYESIVIIGTDCPYLNKEILNNAFKILEENDVALGPAKDGGYYLLGLKTVIPELFKNIPWSTDKVLELSVDVIRSKKLSFRLLPLLSDIDTLEDWKDFKIYLKKG
jgi:rSAM/selenodomain-associated transferase 1